ncbi:DUF3299 domain-containing protein [Vibrio breoganii]
MKKVLLICVALFSGTLSAKSLTLDWDDLRPEAPANTITLPELSDEHRVEIQRIFTLMHSSNPEDAEQINEIAAKLKEQGIDALALLQQREQYITEQKRAAETITTEYDGKNVRIPGFLVPIEFADAMVATEFLLVPVAGACIHMPPPPANQIVRVSFPKGYPMKTVQYPVWVEGTISSELKSEDVYIVDGTSNITMGYSLNATLVKDYE